MDNLFSEKEIKKIKASLLEWYDKNLREFPWRETSERDDDEEKRAYAVLVLEIRLQQTRI